jgi:hypothetical protein
MDNCGIRLHGAGYFQFVDTVNFRDTSVSGCSNDRHSQLCGRRMHQGVMSSGDLL